jgi:hypothetical protein
LLVAQDNIPPIEIKREKITGCQDEQDRRFNSLLYPVHPVTFPRRKTP